MSLVNNINTPEISVMHRRYVQFLWCHLLYFLLYFRLTLSIKDNSNMIVKVWRGRIVLKIKSRHMNLFTFKLFKFVSLLAHHDSWYALLQPAALSLSSRNLSLDDSIDLSNVLWSNHGCEEEFLFLLTARLKRKAKIIVILHIIRTWECEIHVIKKICQK